MVHVTVENQLVTFQLRRAQKQQLFCRKLSDDLGRFLPEIASMRFFVWQSLTNILSVTVNN